MTRRRCRAPLRQTISVLLFLTAAACSREATAPAIDREVRVTAAVASKAPQGPAVASANPAFGDQGTTLDVRVLGSGFTSGAQATWLLQGNPNAHVKTNHTQFISSNELVANVTIAPDAAISFWDVQVALIGGKNGVGSDVFEVTSAQLLGASGTNLVTGVNELLEVGGYTGASNAFIFDAASNFVSLGQGQVWAVDPRGSMAIGRDGNSRATVWSPQSNGSWVPQELPTTPNSDDGNATSAAYAADGTLLIGGWDATPPTRKLAGLNRPAVWRRVGTSWVGPTLYTIPAGSTKGSARTVNGLGQVAGNVDASGLGAIWDDPNTSARLDGLPNAINSAGTLVVGNGTSGPVYWWRDPVTHLWHTTGTLLPSIAGSGCTHGTAIGLNDANMIVGSSCNSNGKDQATVWFLDFSGAAPTVTSLLALPGLGVQKPAGAEVSAASGVTASSPYTVAGRVQSGGQNVVVRWRIQ